MTHEPEPLKYLGTQSRESMNMAAALAERAAEDAARSEGLDDPAKASAIGAAVGAAAQWAAEQAQGLLRSATSLVGDAARAKVVEYTRADPLRAVIVAAAAGAMVALLAVAIARSALDAGQRQARRAGMVD